MVESIPSFNTYIEQSIVKHWDRDALTDYKGITLQFHDVARKIEKLHILFEGSGVSRGDKIALCGRNSSHWGVAFLATLTYGAVAVPIQSEFTAEQIHNIVNHSDAKLLFVGDVVATQIDAAKMPGLEGIIYLPDYSLLESRTEQLTYAREHLNEMFGKKFPKFFRKEHIAYYKDTDPRELAIINYTSGTTGFSKGVMLSYGALWSNIDFLLKAMEGKVGEGSNMVCTLPMAHMYGLAIDFLYGFIHGCHLYFLTRLPSPSLIVEAFGEIHPRLISTVPMVLEKIVKKKIYPLTQTNRVRLLLSMPVVSKRVKELICAKVHEVFGGNTYQVVVAGAPLSGGVEDFLRGIGFPLTIAYGTTETAPFITFADQAESVAGSCGKVVPRLDLRIDSQQPSSQPGEIVVKGINMMNGYYKNEEATQKVVDSDGWFHTGDLATIDAEGHVFIRGRIKNMLLGSNGQNVYPEEIEDTLNSMALVSESIVVQRGERLVALVYPDREEARSLDLDEADLQGVMEENRQQLNSQLPPFCKISEIVLQDEEFQKTPKKSIKRYLYK